MKIAVKNTLWMIAVYVVIAIVLGSLTLRQLRTTIDDVSDQTARFTARQLTAGVFVPVMDAVLERDRNSRTDLERLVETASERSNALVSLDVIAADGTVISSDDDRLLNTKKEIAADVFPDELMAHVVAPSAAAFAPGIRQVRVPLVRRGELEGYLDIGIKNTSLAALYDSFLFTLILVALAGLMIILGVGAMMQHQLSRIGTGLVNAVRAKSSDESEAHYLRGDEFDGVRDAFRSFSTELEHAKVEAGYARQNLDTLARVLRIGVILLTRDAEPKFVSEAATMLFAGETPSQFSHRFGSCEEAISDAIARLEGQSGATESIDVDIPTDVAALHLRLEIYSLANEVDKEYLMLVKDRSSIESLNADLRAASRLHGLSVLFMGATHDLRAPLSAMGLNLELLKESIDRQAASASKLEQQHYVQVIQGETERLSQQLDVVLSQATPPQDTRQVVDLLEATNDLILLIRTQANSQLVRVALTHDQSPPYHVMGYDGQLKQVILNIIINALEAMQSGGDLHIKFGRHEDMVHVEVTDTGGGIPKSLLPKIFDMHFTTRDRGTGIGLYVAQLIIQQHGGRISVKSKLGEGSVFTIELPSTDRTSPARDTASARDALAEPSAS